MSLKMKMRLLKSVSLPGLGISPQIVVIARNLQKTSDGNSLAIKVRRFLHEVVKVHLKAKRSDSKRQDADCGEMLNRQRTPHYHAAFRPGLHS